MIIIRYILSRKILAFLLLFYFINYIVQGKLDSLFALEPQALIHRFEFWRLITYPLSPGSFEAIILLFFSFYIIAPKLEYIFKTGLYPLFMILLIILHGLIHTVVFWDKQIILSGMEGIAIFNLVLFTLIKPKQEIKFSFLPGFKLIYMTLFFMFGWASLKYLNAYIWGSDILLSGTASLIFGVTSGALSFLQIKFLNRILSYKKEIRNTLEPEIEDLKEPVYDHQSRYRMKPPLWEPSSFNENDPEENERKLNDILDKILESGKDSLTEDEIHFLEEYSRKM